MEIVDYLSLGSEKIMERLDKRYVNRIGSADILIGLLKLRLEKGG